MQATRLCLCMFVTAVFGSSEPFCILMLMGLLVLSLHRKSTDSLIEKYLLE